MVLPSVNLVPTLFTRGNFSLSVSKRAEGTGAVYAIDSSPTDCLDTAAEKKLCPSQVVQPTRRPPRYPGEELLRKLIFANVTATDSHIKGGVCQAKKYRSIFGAKEMSHKGSQKKVFASRLRCLHVHMPKAIFRSRGVGNILLLCLL